MFAQKRRLASLRPIHRKLGSAPLRSSAWVLALSALACGGEAVGTEAEALGEVAQATTTVAPPDIKVKLNDDLSAFAEVVLPGAAEMAGLERITLPKQELFRATKAEMKQHTGAVVDAVLDATFSCHNDFPLVIELRNLALEVPVSENSVELDVAGDGLDVDADLSGLRLTGKLWLDWPKDTGFMCKNVTGRNHHIEVPFTVAGAEIAAHAGLGASGGTLRVSDVDIGRLALGSVDIDHDELNFATDALLLLADVIASSVQELSDGSLDSTPENGICGTPGSSANLDRCIESALSTHVVPELEDALEDALETALDSATLPSADIAWSGFSASFDPNLDAVSARPQRNFVSFDVDANLTSTAPTAACATAVSQATPLSAEGTFEAIGDIDVIVPYDGIQNLAYEVARQGVLCVPLSVPGIPLTLSLNPAGPVTIPVDGFESMPTSSPASGSISASGTTSTTSPSGSTTANLTSSSGGGLSGSTIPVDAGPAVMVDLDNLVFTRHPSKLGYPATLGTGNIEVTVELGWLVEVDCDGQLQIDLIVARREAARGSIRTRAGTLDASNPDLSDALDDIVASLPGRVGQQPLGPSLKNLELMPGVFLSPVALERGERELAVGFDISDRPSPECDVEEDTPPPAGDDTPDFDPPTLTPADLDDDDPRDPGTLDGTDQPSDESLFGR